MTRSRPGPTTLDHKMPLSVGFPHSSVSSGFGPGFEFLGKAHHAHIRSSRQSTKN